MPISKTDLEALVTGAFPDAKIQIEDLAGDNDHYSLQIISEQFRGKSRVEQHKLVNNALKGTVGGTLHALALKTSAPANE
jgi:stress-induced morphogen